MRTTGLSDIGIGIKIVGRDFNNLILADDTMIFTKDPNDLELLLNKVSHASAKVGL